MKRSLLLGIVLLMVVTEARVGLAEGIDLQEQTKKKTRETIQSGTET